MTTPARALLLAASAWLAACEGSEVRRLLNADLDPPDTIADEVDGDEDGDVADAPDTDQDGDAADTEGDGDTSTDGDSDVGPDVPTLAFWFEGATGALGRDLVELVLVARDEPAAYAELPGFQIDVVAETRGVALGQVARLLIDGRLAASAQVRVEDDVGHLSIPGLTLPDRGAPLRVRLETTSTDGAPLADEKRVSLALGACEITARLALSPEGCLEPAAPGIIAAPRIVRVEVQRLAGACDRVAGIATLPDGVSLALAEVPFTADGAAELAIPIAFGATPSGSVSVEITALHPSDPSLHATTTASARIDLAPPGVRWLAPRPEVTTLTLLDDQDGDPSNGLQVPVRVAIVAAPDELVGATLVLDDGHVAQASVRGGGTLDFGVVTFARLGPATLRVEAGDECDNQAIEQRTFTVAIPAPTLVIDEPSASCSSTDVLGLSGRATGLSGRPLELVAASPDPRAGPVVVSDFATVSPAGDWSGTFRIGADGRWVFSVSGTDAFGQSASADLTIDIDRAAPEVLIDAPPAVLDGTTTPDAEPDVEGFQADVSVVVLAAQLGDTVCLEVNGRAAGCLPASGVGTITFGAVTLVAGDNTLIATARDGCGNVAAPVTRTVRLTLETPIAIVTPVSGATLLAAGDGNAQTVTIYETTMTLDADLAVTGATLTVECRPAAGGVFAPVGGRTLAGVVANGRYSVPVALDTLTLGTRVQCRAQIDRPSPGTSATIDLTIGLPAPTLTITSPTTGACLRADVAVAGGAGALEGRTITARLTGGVTARTSEATATRDSWSTTITLGATAPDGSYNLSASATDSVGNPAAAGPIALVVDRTAPVLAFVTPGPDVSEADDVSTASGVQVGVVATLQDARPGGQVCLALGAAAPTCRTPSGASATFSDITLQPGDNLLTLTGADACGNPAAPVERLVRLELDAPLVAITTPGQDLVTTATTLDLVATITDADLVPLAGLSPKLLADGVDTLIAPRDEGAGRYAFDDTPLAPGKSTSFIVEVVRPNSALGRSAPRIVTQKNTIPTIALTAPSDGTRFTLASTECAAGSRDCVLTARATTTHAEDGSAAELVVACGGTPTLHRANVVGGAVTFNEIGLTDGQVCTLTPSVTDVVGQRAAGATVTVSVDRTAPSIAITTPGPILQAEDDADPIAAGMQHALAAEVGGVAAGAVVSATLSWNDGAPRTRTLTHTVTTTTPDGASYLATIEDTPASGVVDWPDGLVTLVVAVTDASGNPGSQTLVVSVDTDAAVRITFPTAVPAETCGAGCAAGTTCADGQCWIAWGTGASRQLVALASGMETTANNIRVCSDHPALADSGAPTCASSASATGPYRQVLLTNTSGGSTALGLGSALPAGAQRLVVEILPVSGGDWVSSLLAVGVTEQQRRVFVDLQAPAVTSIGSPSDTLAPLGTLSAAEQAALPRAFDVAFTTSEAGRAQVFVNGAVAVTQNVPAGATTVRVTLPEGTPQVWVVMSDVVGNLSPATPGQGALTYQPTVDVTAPTLAFTRPAKSPLALGDSREVVLASNAEGRTVTVSDGDLEVAAGTVAGGGVTFAHATSGILSDGSHSLTAIVTDAAGNAASAATSPAIVLVDTQPPAGAITAPSEGQALTEADDASAATAGFQLSVAFTTSGATRWSLLTASGCDAAFTGCQAAVVKASGDVTNPGGAEPAALVTLDATAAESFHVVSLRTLDAAGNQHLTSVGVSLTLSCAIAFVNLPASGWYDGATCGSATSCAGVIVQVARAGDCGNRLELFDGATSLGVSTSADPVVSFAISIADGVPLVLEAVAYQGNIGNERGATGIAPIGVDLVPPTVSFIATDVQGFDTPADGEALSYGYLDDLDPSAPGMQLHAAVAVSDSNADGGAITALVATSSAGSVDLVPANATLPLALTGSSPITTELRSLTLADHLTHTVTVTARDAAGNTDTSTFVASVDVTRPESVAITGFVVNPRRPSFDIGWTAIGIGAAPAAAYAIRYSTLPIVTEDDWDAACDASLLLGSEPMPAPAAPGEPMSISVGGPDARPFTDPCKLDVRFDAGEPPSDVALFFAVRAFDAAGNGSEIGEESTVSVSNAELWNDVSIVRFDDRDGLFAMTSSELAFLSFRGATLGDIDGDGREDWAVGSILSKAFCVFLGQGSLLPELLVTSPEGPSHTCLLSSEVASIGGAFAGATQTGHHFEPLGDLNGDGLGDFGVSGKLSNGVNGAPSNGYILVYLGQRGKLPVLTSPNLKIHGLRAQTGSPFFTGFCGAGDFDGALTNGRKTSDLVIGEPAAGVAHVLPGQGTWTSSTVLDLDLGMNGSLAGAWTVRGEFADPAAALFGSRCAPAGDVLPTPAGLGDGPRDDLLLAQTGGTSPRVFVFAGRDVPGGVSEVVHEQLGANPTGEDARSLRLWQESVGSRGGFGVNLQGGVDLTGDGVADVLASVGARSPELGGDGKSVYVFDGARLASLLGTDVRVGVSGEPVGESWAGLNGWVLRASVASNNRAARAIGDFDGWRAGGTGGASIDLAIADNNSNATTSVALRLNQLRSPDVVWGRYPFVDAELVNRYTPEVNALGTWIEGGADFDGDGLPDLITGSTSGEVLIFH